MGVNFFYKIEADFCPWAKKMSQNQERPILAQILLVHWGRNASSYERLTKLTATHERGSPVEPLQRTLLVWLSGAVLAASAATPSHAAVIYDNGAPNQTANQLADTSYFFTQAADEFTLAPGNNTIDDVHWWGGCVINDGGTLTTGTTCPTGNFTLHIYSDSGSNSPGTLLNTFNVGNADQTLTGNTIAARGGIPEYSYSTTIPALTLPAGTEYWLGISNTTTTDVVWGWEFTTQGTGDAFQLGDGIWNARSNELAFNLTGVPEPGSLAIIGAGLLGLVGMRRRRAPKA